MKIKRKGAYQYEGLGWHMNHGGLVIPMAAEAAMLYGKDVEEYIRTHDNDWDFLLRTKVPRNSSLVLVYEFHEEPQQNICRYYIAKEGGKLVKIMPPLEDGGEDRRLGIDTEWNVLTCNDMKDFDRSKMDYDYYVAEAKKLILNA